MNASTGHRDDHDRARRTALASWLQSWLPAPLHSVPKLLSAHAFTFADKLALARAFSAILRLDQKVPSTESLGAWLKRKGQTQGALNRFWRLVIASALNADLDSIALPYAAKVIRELFMNSAVRGQHGHEHRSSQPISTQGAADYLVDRGSERSVQYQCGIGRVG
jgi:predicted NAD/FAD-binding protein